MSRRIKQITRAAVLLFFSLYAVSPVYMSSVIGSEGRGFENECRAKNATIGIVWLDILVSSFVDKCRDYKNAAGAEVSVDSKDCDMVLVKKKRAVLCERYRVKPLPETDVLPLSNIENIEYLLALLREFGLSRDPRHQETDGYISLNTGLSPPALLS